MTATFIGSAPEFEKKERKKKTIEARKI